MFYLKYRPHTLDEIDNSRVREIIRKILISKKLPHALLFIGPKGTGKTSTARILAKSVNCLAPRNGDPCNHCANCLTIDSSTSPDVLELDAASNRGINEIKSLIQDASFLPLSSKYRLFIIDEAHMITNDGFNALLKTLEEPPSSVIFILATTNPEKIPQTITSRCLTVNFGKAIASEIKHMLQRIAVQEKIKLQPELIDFISTHSEHSFRDAAKLLEELVIQQKLTLDEAKQYLGIRGKQSLLEVVQKEPVEKALIWTDQFTQSGGNVKNLIEELLEELHLLLLIKNKVMKEDEKPLQFSIVEITKLMRLLTEAYTMLRTSPIDIVPLEIAIVEFYNGKKKVVI